MNDIHILLTVDRRGYLKQYCFKIRWFSDKRLPPSNNYVFHCSTLTSALYCTVVCILCMVANQPVSALTYWPPCTLATRWPIWGWPVCLHTNFHVNLCSYHVSKVVFSSKHGVFWPPGGQNCNFWNQTFQIWHHGCNSVILILKYSCANPKIALFCPPVAKIVTFRTKLSRFGIVVVTW